MTIVSSTFTEGPPQVDGRRYVKEYHTDNSGLIYTFEWLGSQEATDVISARSEKLSNMLDRKREVKELTQGTKLPLSKLEFRRLFKKAEREAVDEFNETYVTLADLTAKQKKQIRTALKDFDNTSFITRPFDPDVEAMLALYQAMGLLTAERVAEIMAAGNG